MSELRDWSEGEKTQLRAMRARGVSVKAIARTLNRPTGQVENKLALLGIAKGSRSRRLRIAGYVVPAAHAWLHEEAKRRNLSQSELLNSIILNAWAAKARLYKRPAGEVPK